MTIRNKIFSFCILPHQLGCIFFFLLCCIYTVKSSERHRVASLREQAYADAWLLQATAAATSSVNTTTTTTLQKWDCPCDDQDLCVTIQGPPLLPTREFFGFANTQTKDVSYFNWTFLSTVAWASDEIMCEAHKHGARAVISTPSMNLTTLQDATARQTWVQNVVYMIKSRFMDGVTFDYEEPMVQAANSSQEAATYVQLVQETTKQLHAFNPSLQVTVCVAWSPDGIDGRNYPVQALAQVADALYVMDYDTQSQIMFGPCIAAANAPYYGMIHGVMRYLSLGIAPSKLILGVPWYGYRYPCQSLSLSDAHSRFCPIQPVPFRGVPCSDAAGMEIPVLKILQRLYESGARLQRDDNQDAPYFNAIEQDSTGRNNITVIQYWFDDPTSLRHKYAWAQSQNLAGVGPYALIDMNPNLDPIWGPKHAEAYWAAFDAFYGVDNAAAV